MARRLDCAPIGFSTSRPSINSYPSFSVWRSRSSRVGLVVSALMRIPHADSTPSLYQFLRRLPPLPQDGRLSVPSPSTPSGPGGPLMRSPLCLLPLAALLVVLPVRAEDAGGDA